MIPNNDKNESRAQEAVAQDIDSPVELPEPRVEEIEAEWAALSCGCDCEWG